MKSRCPKAKPWQIIKLLIVVFNDHSLWYLQATTAANTSFLRVLNIYASMKTKLIRANEVSYMTKPLRKAIMTRSRLENKYHKNKID